MYANTGGMLTPKSERNSVKKVILAFQSLFLCSASSCVPEGMIWLRTFFALMNNAMYITMGTKLPIVCPTPKYTIESN